MWNRILDCIELLVSIIYVKTKMNKFPIIQLILIILIISLLFEFDCYIININNNNKMKGN